MTEKLYDSNSYMTEFDAQVISCIKTEKGYKTQLNKTAFFPTEGGQLHDTGTIDNIPVTNVEIENDIIYHYCDSPIDEGRTVHGKIDFKERYRKMQNHTGEHIICGFAHKLYGCENVGFHLGADYVTMDLDKPLNDEELHHIEILANEAIYTNSAIKSYYPTKEELEKTDFRSKDGINGSVRLVEIEGIDICACCAPHVKRTGEVGIIKILDRINYKGGVRLNILCGFDAFKDYHERYKRNLYISNLLSAKQEDVNEAMDKLLENMARLRADLGEKSARITRLYLENIQETEESICLFVSDMSGAELRHLANGLMKKTKKLAAVFSKTDANGYNYIVGSESIDLKELCPTLNKELGGRGGGNSSMIQGSLVCSENKIKEFIAGV